MDMWQSLNVVPMLLIGDVPMAVQESAAEKSDNSDPSTYVEVCLQSTVLSHLNPVATAVPSSGLPTDDADSAYDRHWKEVLITRFPTLLDCMSSSYALAVVRS